ncbi:MAG: hypothetical protein LAN71_11705 [Acidobacteriia bacterium]|nr:hypothetical protein [Terriglobia bacterium]
MLVLGATGEAREKSIHEAARAYEFSDLKGDVDALGGLAGGLRWQQGGGEWLHAGHRARVLLGAEELGTAGRLARRVAEKLKLRQDAYLAELRLEPFYAAARALGEARRYVALPRFPAVERDFSLLLAEGTAFADVAGAIRALGIREVVAVEATDLFRGKNVPAGKYSLLVRVQFQSGAGTLTDEQIGGFCGQIVGALEKRLGAVLRAQ